VFKRSKPKSPVTKLNNYSYYKSTSNTSSNRRITANKGLFRFAKTLKPHISIFRLLIILLGVVIVGYLLSVDIKPIIRFTSTGVNARSTDLYRSESQAIIGRSIFNRSKLTFDYRSVEEELLRSFPEIEKARISFDVVGRKPVIQIYMHKPTYLFQTNGTSWAIDDRGVAIGRRDDLKDSFTGSLAIVTDELGADVEIGDTLISPPEITFLTSVIKLLNKQQVVLESIYIPLSPKQIDLVVKGEGWRYKLNSNGKPTLQAGSLLAARETLKSNGNTPSEYVDLRVTEKVYWK